MCHFCNETESLSHLFCCIDERSLAGIILGKYGNVSKLIIEHLPKSEMIILLCQIFRYKFQLHNVFLVTKCVFWKHGTIANIKKTKDDNFE